MGLGAFLVNFTLTVYTFILYVKFFIRWEALYVLTLYVLTLYVLTLYVGKYYTLGSFIRSDVIR